jgi:hypothetical protein
MHAETSVKSGALEANKYGEAERGGADWRVSERRRRVRTLVRPTGDLDYHNRRMIYF